MDAHPRSKIAAQGLTYDVRAGSAEARRLLDDVSFAVASGSVFTILGPSGSGKSTLLRCLNRLVEPTGGRVLLEDTPTTGIPVQALRRRVGMMFQSPALFDGTVMDNVLYGPRLRAAEPQPGGAARDQALALLRRVGLAASLCERPAEQLSGGEAQRVSLARALANEPEVLLLDEPTASLDPAAGRVIEELLLGLAAEADLTLIFVTHDLAQARRVGDHGLLLVGGRVADQGELPGFLETPGSELTRLFVEGRLGEAAPERGLAAP